jgi:hypothetical protein
MLSLLPMRSKVRVLALISVLPKLLDVLDTSSGNRQMLAAEQLLPGLAAWVALPVSNMVKILGHYPPAESIRMPIKVNTLSFCLICLSPPPPLKFRCTVHRHSHLCSTQNTSKREYMKGGGGMQICMYSSNI